MGSLPAVTVAVIVSVAVTSTRASVSDFRVALPAAVFPTSNFGPGDSDWKGLHWLPPPADS